MILILEFLDIGTRIKIFFLLGLLSLTEELCDSAVGVTYASCAELMAQVGAWTIRAFGVFSLHRVSCLDGVELVYNTRHLL